MGESQDLKNKYIELIKLRMQAKHKMLAGNVKILKNLKKELAKLHAK